jgi:hypothetical protein
MKACAAGHAIIYATALKMQLSQSHIATDGWSVSQ